MAKGFRGFFKDYLKNFSWGLITLPLITLVLYGLTAIIDYFELGKLVGSTQLQDFIKVLLSYFKQHPYRIFISVSIIGVLFTNSLFLWRSNNLLRSFGAFSFSQHASKVEKDKDWEAFVNTIESSSTLFIMGATGYKTFKTRNSPLYETVRSFQGNIDILLLSPDSHSLHVRANTVGQSITEYRKEIKQSMQYLKELNKKRRRISLRLYSSEPDWKVIMSNNHLWLQYYSPENHVDDTPVYGLYADVGNSSLYYMFQYEFIKKWRAATKIKI